MRDREIEDSMIDTSCETGNRYGVTRNSTVFFSKIQNIIQKGLEKKD